MELLKTRLKQQGYVYQVVNASVSGETTAGGLARLPRALQVQHPKVLVVELGGNDGLRALPLAQMRTNLAQMIDSATAAGAKVLLLGMRMPPNYGPEIHRTISPRIRRSGAGRKRRSSTSCSTAPLWIRL